MIQDPDGIDPEDPTEGRPSEPSSGGGRKLDEDAAWRAIIENYGARADLGSEPASPDAGPDSGPDAARETEPQHAPVEPSQTAGPAALETGATWDDEGHFIPPVPLPLPPLEPRRKLAWAGLFGSPLLMLVAVVFGWSYPGWLMGALVIGLVGGFGYLVATMPRNRPEGWSGDDGAVV